MRTDAARRAYLEKTLGCYVGWATAPSAVYEPRKPRASPLYALDDRYQQQYGRWRSVIGEVMRKYLECGDLHRGFARLACDGCRYQAIFCFR